MLKRLLCSCIILFLYLGSELSVHAGPLNPSPYKVKQPNGTEIVLRNFGDEWYSYIQTIDGYTVGISYNGSFYYCKKGPSGNLTLSDILVNPEIKRGSREKRYLKKTGKNLQPDQHIIDQLCDRNPYNLKNISNQQSLISSLQQKSGGPKVINLCVLLVEFDEVGHLIPKANFERFFNGETPTTVKSYYQDASYGDIEIQADIYDWYRDNTPLQNRDYNKPVEQMLNNAILGLDGQIDFSKYDNNNDGKLDAIIMVYAGELQKTNNESRYDFGAYAGSLGNNYKLTVDGVEIDRMCCTSELKANGEQQAVGVAIHELGHLLFNLPDIYDTAYNTNGVGNFCTMGTLWLDGGWTPPMLGAFSKVTAGFVDPVIIPELTDSVYSIPMAYFNDDAIFKIIMPDNPTEYFLVENRQKVLNDRYLPGDGMLIWHIDIKMSGNNSINSDHPRVTLEQADGYNHLLRKINQGDSGDPFPGSRFNRTFDKDSRPNSNDWYGHLTNIAVTNISDSDSIMTANMFVPEAVNADSVMYFDLVYNDFEDGLGKFENKPQVSIYTGEEYAYQGDKALMTGGNPGWAGVVQGPWTTIDPAFQQIMIEFYFITTGFSGQDRIKFWIWDGHNGNGWGNIPLNYGDSFENNKFYKCTATIPRGGDYSFNPNANFAIMPEAGSNTRIYVDQVSLSGTFKKEVERFTLNLEEVQKDLTSIDDLAVDVSDINIYPNPTKGITHFEIYLKKDSEVSIGVYNSSGQLIESLSNKRLMPAGLSNIRWNPGNNLGPGVYFIKIVIDNQIYTRKILIE